MWAKEVMDAFKEAARLQSGVADAERKSATLRSSARKSTPTRAHPAEHADHRPASALYSRYMKKLTDQETKLEALVGAGESGEHGPEDGTEKMTGYVANLNVE